MKMSEQLDSISEGGFVRNPLYKAGKPEPKNKLSKKQSTAYDAALKSLQEASDDINWIKRRMDIVVRSKIESGFDTSKEIQNLKTVCVRAKGKISDVSKSLTKLK